MVRILKQGITVLSLLMGNQVMAADVVNSKLMTLELANELAMEAVKACRKNGYQVAAVVVDRGANTQVVMRDVYAARFTIEIAERKANSVILSGVPSGEFRTSRQDIRMELDSVDGLLLLDGALPVRAGGVLLGAIGVSGAPGGERDAACAQVALDKVQDRLDFID